jgi:MFS family permease
MRTETSGRLPSKNWFRLWQWFRYDFFGIVPEMRLSYLPPLMVYFAAGVSGFTGIVESFYVKQELGLSAAFLAGLGFWAGLPWALKMPLGHLVDLFWRRKAIFVYIGAILMAASLLIMVGLTGSKDQMARFLAPGTWYVISSLLSPIGFVLQDVVADAMTVEAVPSHTDQGIAIPETELKRMHITMQTLGRIAIIGGSALVAGVGGWLAKTLSYSVMYELALLIPAISVLGVIIGQFSVRLHRLRLRRSGMAEADIRTALHLANPELAPNWYILGGSAAFVIISLTLGLSDVAVKKEVIFLGSLTVIAFLMGRLLKDLGSDKRREIIGIAIVIFIFRAMPGVGAGASWWQIDVLGFDEAFFGTLRQIASILAIIGLFALRGWMTRRPITYLVWFSFRFITL